VQGEGRKGRVTPYLQTDHCHTIATAVTKNGMKKSAHFFKTITHDAPPVENFWLRHCLARCYVTEYYIPTSSVAICPYLRRHALTNIHTHSLSHAWRQIAQTAVSLLMVPVFGIAFLMTCGNSLSALIISFPEYLQEQTESISVWHWQVACAASANVSFISDNIIIIYYPHRLCRSAWAGFSSQSVCLIICLFVRSITQKTNDPKVFNLGIGMTLG